MNATSLVLAGRLILLLLASAATVTGFALSRERDVAASESSDRYVCPMHPEVTSGEPGECPICRMALEQVHRASSASASSSPAPSSAPGTGPAHGPAALSHAESANRLGHRVIGTAKEEMFARQVRAPAWVDKEGRLVAALYKDELVGLLPGEHALFFRAGAPGAGVDVTRTTEPPTPWDGSTSEVHFRLAPGASPTVPTLRPGDVGWLKLAARHSKLLVVPSSAVLYSSEGPYVLVASTDRRTFSKRRVEVGRAFRGLTVVLSGLRPAEPIAHFDAFFLDAERRLQSGRQEAVEAVQ